MSDIPTTRDERLLLAFQKLTAAINTLARQSVLGGMDSLRAQSLAYEAEKLAREAFFTDD